MIAEGIGKSDHKIRVKPVGVGLTRIRSTQANRCSYRVNGILR